MEGKESMDCRVDLPVEAYLENQPVPLGMVLWAW